MVSGLRDQHAIERVSVVPVEEAGSNPIRYGDRQFVGPIVVMVADQSASSASPLMRPSRDLMVISHAETADTMTAL